MLKCLLSCCLFVTVSASYATVKLPTVLSSNMVLQQNEKVCLWGSAKANSTVTIKPSWSGKATKTQVDKNGKWVAYVETAKAGGPYSITFDDGEKLTLNNILLGDVWICSGQSNMEMPLKGFTGQPVKESLKFITESQGYPEVRMYTGKQTASLSEESDNQGSWEQASIQNAPQFSAIGYFYAKELYDVLKTPIGMIHVSWGGASIESWMSEGFIWYQGESNIGNYKEYASLFSDMVKEWRNLFKAGEKLPFYYVEMGLYPMYVELPGFEVAGNDGKFYTAKAVVNQFGNTMEVWSDQVEAPEYLRYAFKNYIQGSLYNGSGLPASSFRTDTF